MILHPDDDDCDDDDSGTVIVKTICSILYSLFFRRVDQLEIHLLKSRNEDTWFTCHICQEKFSQSGHFNVHLLHQTVLMKFVW